MEVKVGQEDFEIFKSHASFYRGMAFVTVGWLSVFLPIRCQAFLRIWSSISRVWSISST